MRLGKMVFLLMKLATIPGTYEKDYNFELGHMECKNHGANRKNCGSDW
jgi:hypothetical protein